MNEGQHIKQIERMIKNNESVILNSGFEVVNVKHWHKAIELTVAGRAQIVAGKTNGELVRSQLLTFPKPLIVALNKYVVPRISATCVLNKSTILARDNYTCVYCGDPGFTIDHVFPKSKGGKNTWDNMVASCQPCNSRKADRLIRDIGYNEPIIPDEDDVRVENRFAMVDKAVQKYLTEEYAQDYENVDASLYASV